MFKFNFLKENCKTLLWFFFYLFDSNTDFKNQYRINIEDMPSVWKSCQLFCVFLSIKIWGPTTSHCCGSKHWWDNTKYIVYMCVYTQHKKHYRGKMIYWFGVFFFCNAQILGILCIYMKLKDSSNTTPQGCT